MTDGAAFDLALMDDERPAALPGWFHLAASSPAPMPSRRCTGRWSRPAFPCGGVLTGTRRLPRSEPRIPTATRSRCTGRSRERSSIDSRVVDRFTRNIDACRYLSLWGRSNRSPRRARTVTNCNCSICRRYGTLWAYYKATAVRVRAERDATAKNAWGDRTLAFVRCAKSGCVPHWEPIRRKADTSLGVHMRKLRAARARFGTHPPARRRVQLEIARLTLAQRLLRRLIGATLPAARPPRAGSAERTARRISC